MNILKKVLFPAAFLLFLSMGTATAQVDPALIRQAREMGVPQQQIDEAIRQAQAQAENTGSSTSAETSGLESSSAAGLRTRSGTDLELMLFEKMIIDSLTRVRDTVRIFGQEVFSNRNLTFTPNYNLPTPRNYVLAAGDEVVIEVWGNSEMNLRETITTEGSVYLRGIGPVQLNGYTIEEAEAAIRARLATIFEGLGSDTHVKVSLGQIRSIRVNVLGEVLTPGTYTLPSLATLFNALYLAGGVSDIGSLRNIRLIRNNRQVAALDAYDYLIHGKTEANVRLEDNDMIIVPTYDARVWAEGFVKREMGYEMKSGETVADLLEYAGGFRGEAYTDDLLIKRQAGSRYQVFTVDRADFAGFPLHDGDSVKVGQIINRYENRLQITGAVWRPGEYQYNEQINTLSELIVKAGSLTGSQYADRGQITRQKSDFTDEVIPFNVREIVLGTKDIDLQPEDRIYIPTLDEMTERYYILVHGEVNKPDTIPFRYNMNIEDVIILAGGLKESASMANVEVSRRIREPRSVEYSIRIAETFKFPIAENLAVSAEASSFILQPFDEVHVRRSPTYVAQQRVTIGGEILFDGTYVFSRSGERLSEIVRKAGGFTPEAYVRGANLVRRMTDDEWAKVQTKLAIADSNFGRDSLSLKTNDFADSYSVGIDLERALRYPGGPDDLVLRDGDAIYIPRLNNTVKIMGSILMANTVTYGGSDLRYYIHQAGGYTDNARRRPFVVYMNGKVASTRRGFLRRRYPKIEPGCEIIVPEKVRSNRMGLGEWLSIASSTALTSATISNLLRR